MTLTNHLAGLPVIDDLAMSNPALDDEIVSSLFDDHGGDLTGPVILHGAGDLGGDTVSRLRAIGVEPVALTDNDPGSWGQNRWGIGIVAPEDAALRWGRDATFVATVFNPSKAIGQLRGLGARVVLPWTWLYAARAESFLPYWSLGTPSVVHGGLERIAMLWDRLADDASREVLAEQLRWRTTLAPEVLGPPDPFAELYIAPGIVSLTPGAVLADCGAFTGDTIQKLVRAGGWDFRAAHLFEPDLTNRTALEQLIATWRPSRRARTHVHGVGLSDRVGMQSFSMTGSVAATFDPTSADAVPVTTLDRVFGHETPSYVKMDIEGAELRALDGAARILARSATTWAIMTYHRPTDLWEIPLRLLETGDHDVYLRRHAEDCWEICAYAVGRAIR